MDSLLTAKQVQDLLNVDRTTIYRMLKDGRLIGVKVGQHWRFSERDVNDLLNGTPRSDIESPVSVDVLPLHCMQPVQDVFAEIAEVGAVTTDKDGKPLTTISNSCDFCKLILGSENGRQACMHSWAQLTKQSDASPEFIPCHAGLQYARSHIEVNGELIALLISGQFYAETPEPEEEALRIQSLSKKYNIEESLLKQAAEKISVLDQRKVSQIRIWLDKVAHTFEQISKERSNLMGRLRQIAEMSIFDNTLS